MSRSICLLVVRDNCPSEFQVEGAQEMQLHLSLDTVECPLTLELNPNNAGTQHGDQHPCEDVTASNLHSALPCSTYAAAPGPRQPHLCFISSLRQASPTGKSRNEGPAPSCLYPIPIGHRASLWQ